jgi:hypothetical protein
MSDLVKQLRANAASGDSCRGLRVKAADEIERLTHIVGALRFSCQMTGHAAEEIMEHVRCKDGLLEVWSLGEWVDVSKANAEVKS